MLLGEINVTELIVSITNLIFNLSWPLNSVWQSFYLIRINTFSHFPKWLFQILPIFLKPYAHTIPTHSWQVASSLLYQETRSQLVWTLPTSTSSPPELYLYFTCSCFLFPICRRQNGLAHLWSQLIYVAFVSVTKVSFYNWLCLCQYFGLMTFYCLHL